MNETIGYAAITAFSEVSKVIQSLAPEVWRIMMKQQRVLLWTNIFVFVVLLCVFVFCVKKIKYDFRKYEDDSDDIKDDFDDIKDDSDFCLVHLLVWTCMIGCFITMMFLAVAIIGIAINPEYYAIKHMLVFVKSG